MKVLDIYSEKRRKFGIGANEICTMTQVMVN